MEAGCLLDSTYPIYLFKFVNMHPASDGEFLLFKLQQMEVIIITKTSTAFGVYNYESGTQVLHQRCLSWWSRFSSINSVSKFISNLK